MKLRRFIAMGLVSAALAGCGSAQVAPTGLPIVTPGPLNKTAQFWDLGISIKYPVDWPDPKFTSGQMVLTASANTAEASLTQPVVAINIVDINQLGLPKDTSLQDILGKITLGPDVSIRERNAANFAGLDAAYMSLTDNRRQVNGYAMAFRLPDGRVGSMIAIAPISNWADIVPTFENMRLSTHLLKPSEFPMPNIGKEIAYLAPGGINFGLPDNWIARDFQSARIFHDRNVAEYADASGFANGPQLVLRAQYLDKGTTVVDALTKLVAVKSGDRVANVSVGGQPGIQILSSDPVTGQALAFVGFASQDQTVMMIFRLTTPGILVEVTQPTFDTILKSVRYGPITTPMVLQPGPVITQTP